MIALKMTDSALTLPAAYCRVSERASSELVGYVQKTGRDHCPALSISDDMPDTGGGSSTDATDAPVEASSDDDDGESDGDPDLRRYDTHPKELKSRIKKPGREKRHAIINHLTSDDAGTKKMVKNFTRAVLRDATATAGDPPIAPKNPEIALWRLPTVLAHIPVSRSGWWAGVKSGRYPAPVRLSTRCVAWRSEDIRALINSL